MSDRVTRIESDDPLAAAVQAAGESRGTLSRTALLAGGAVAAGGALAGALGEQSAAAPSPALDRRVLSYFLELEYVQEAFYREAEERGRLKGELREYARVAGRDERAHVALLKRMLGGRAERRPRFEFGRLTTNARAFRTAAVKLEELVTRAYIGQGANLTRRHISNAARIASVDARHAAWIHDIAGQHPAPRAADPGEKPERVRRALRQAGFREVS